ncbi:MAG TPA: LacI family DNA-binding transcriptional regulator [Anaerolineaceae bacterium]
MPKKTSSVTIHDVAKAAGVSVSTISRVLNNRVDVAEDTQQHILEVIQQMGYSSNLAARSMRSAHTNLIGMIVPDVEYPYSLEMLKGVNHAITDQKYDLLIYTTGSYQKQDTALHEQHYVRLLNGTVTDGVIVVTPSAALFSTHAPIVSIDPHTLIENYPTIYADHYQGAAEAVRYLVNLNHRRIAYISGRTGLQNGNRYKAYRDVLEEAGIPFDPQLVEEGDFSTQCGAQCARRLLTLPKPPSAIFAANDQSALGVWEAARELGVRIPEDLSLVGFDDIPEAQFSGLTTVHHPLIEMGAMAVELLIKLIEGEKPENYIQKIPTKLVVRNSCQRFAG